MIVCICRVVSDRAIVRAVSNGASSVDEVAAACGAGTGCGACRPQISQMIAECRACCASPSADCPRAQNEVASPAYLAPVGEAA